MHQGEFSSNPKKHSVIFYRARVFGMYVSNIIESTGKTTKTIHDRSLPETRLFDIVGCCNGLICLGDGDLDNEIVLWNPALKLYKFIRASKVDFGVPNMVSLGFGYDAHGDDLKVARIVYKNQMDFTGVEVYSADSDSWTTIELGFRFRVFRNRSNLSVNGNPYWVASVNDDKDVVLVCFDVRKMVFKIVPVPAIYLDNSVGGRVEFVDWKGNLGALLCDNDESGKFTSLGVWVLDDGEGIWRKIHTFGPIQGSVDRFTVGLKNGKLVGKRSDEIRSTRLTHLKSFRKRKLIDEIPSTRVKHLKSFRRRILIVFDPDNGCVDEIVIEEGHVHPFKIYGYVESLIHVKGMIKEAEEREWDWERRTIEEWKRV